jgi:hypothetical protein
VSVSFYFIWNHQWLKFVAQVWYAMPSVYSFWPKNNTWASTCKSLYGMYSWWLFNNPIQKVPIVLRRKAEFTWTTFKSNLCVQWISNLYFNGNDKRANVIKLSTCAQQVFLDKSTVCRKGWEPTQESSTLKAPVSPPHFRLGWKGCQGKIL